MIYLSPAPLYHSAPQAAVSLTIRHGGTAIIMERFDPEAYLALVEKYRVTHTQLVPTMFSRMLKLPEDSPPTIRPVLARDRDSCGGAVPRAGEGTDDRMVGVRSSMSTTAPLKASASLPATARNGWPIAGR